MRYKVRKKTVYEVYDSEHNPDDPGQGLMVTHATSQFAKDAAKTYEEATIRAAEAEKRL